MDLQKWVTKGKEKLLSFGVKEWGMLLVAGLCCLVIVFPTKKEEEENQKGVMQQTGLETGMQNTESADYVTRMEEKLSELLSGVEHVGKVSVMITVNGSVEKNILQDGSRETEQMTETDSAGGSRNSVSERSEGTTVFSDTEGESAPYVLSENYPEITGVVVIAEGSGTGTVDLDILSAVQVLFDLPAHKIRIMKMK